VATIVVSLVAAIVTRAPQTQTVRLFFPVYQNAFCHFVVSNGLQTLMISNKRLFDVFLTQFNFGKCTMFANIFPFFNKTDAKISKRVQTINNRYLCFV